VLNKKLFNTEPIAIYLTQYHLDFTGEDGGQHLSFEHFG
jgi:hypothetical protein